MNPWVSLTRPLSSNSDLSKNGLPPRPQRATPLRNKTVFVLGAGASAVDSIPAQRDLLAKAFEPGFVLADRVDLGILEEQKAHIREFAGRLYGIKDVERLVKIPLEDPLTAIDRAMRRRETLQGINSHDLEKFRRAFQFCIAAVIDSAQSRANGNLSSATARFSERLARDAERNKERHVILSLNWDTLLDRALVSARPRKSWIVDYCTYTYHWDRDDQEGDTITKDISHITKVPRRWKTLKVLKPHGSLNWLYCPTCDRLFTHADRNIGRFGAYPPGNGRRRYCKFCGKERSTVEPLIISPTMLKDLEQTHLRVIWHNAHIELSEASEVVFIGYSFPTADYEFRYLLARALGSGEACKRPMVRVVLYERPTATPREKIEFEQTKERYGAFFPRATVTGEGFSDWVKAEFP